MRRQQLTETQIAALFDPPTDSRELIRHYTLSAGVLAIFIGVEANIIASVAHSCCAICAIRGVR